jgi:hypothetical protein
LIRLLYKLLEDLRGFIISCAIIEIAIHIVFLLQEFHLIAKSFNQLKLGLILLLEVEENLFTISRCRYSLVLNIALELFILGLVDSEFGVLLLKCLALALEDIIIHD